MGEREREDGVGIEVDINSGSVFHSMSRTTATFDAILSCPCDISDTSRVHL